MESKRAFLAIFLSLGVLLGYQFLFMSPPVQETIDQPQNVTPEPTAEVASTEVIAASGTIAGQPYSLPIVQAPIVEPSRSARDIKVETSLYSAVITEAGGSIKNFRLKDYREALDKDSALKELVTTESNFDLPLVFSWSENEGPASISVLQADAEQLWLNQGQGEARLVMRGRLTSGLELTRTMVFNDQDYLIQLEVEVFNPTSIQQQGTPRLNLINRPFSKNRGTKFLFTGPATFANDELKEFKTDDLLKDSDSVQGQIDWVAYENTYFMCSIMPLSENGPQTASFSVSDHNKSTIVLAGEQDIIPPGGRKVYRYAVYFGPKKLSILEQMGANLDQIVDFGWFAIIARPTLSLLNFLHGYFHNYGVAIILVTILIKLLFWPIASKGMKSMKNMQKIQPKMAKIKEKYKDDKERLNKEMMNLYKTYKVNPLGGCLPMLLQIPVFFALYKVLLQAIELRHAPFFLWIDDLSAPDRLFIGFDIPFLGGLPILVLLMGGSMYLQQKMTPTSADPAQAKVMMFLPVIFTFMFLNFASGLVLYWFVNNLLAMAQQYIINRQVDA